MKNEKNKNSSVKREKLIELLRKLNSIYTPYKLHEPVLCYSLASD